MCVHTQTFSGVDIQTAVDYHDDGVSSDEDVTVIADSDSKVDTTSTTECCALSPTASSLSAAVNGEIRQLSGENSSNVCDNNGTCLTELGSATPGDTTSRQVVDENYADSSTADIAVQHVANTDVPVTARSDSETNVQDVDAVSSSVQHNQDIASESEADVVVDPPQVLVEEIATSDSTPPAERSSSKEPKRNDGRDQADRPNTMLSWSDSPHGSKTSNTKCAVQFENSVIFDLDVE